MPRCPQCHLINPSTALACDCGHQFTDPDTSTPTIDRQRRRERFKTWLVDKSIALASAVIALCALVATIQQGYAVRQHQRLSMIPWLGFSFDHNEKGAEWTMDRSGPGSALFQTFEVFVDGVPQPHWNAVAGALGLPGVPCITSRSHIQVLFLRPAVRTRFFGLTQVLLLKSCANRRLASP
jgi:hypothetical protein